MLVVQERNSFSGQPRLLRKQKHPTQTTNTTTGDYNAKNTPPQWTHHDLPPLQCNRPTGNVHRVPKGCSASCRTLFLSTATRVTHDLTLTVTTVFAYARPTSAICYVLQTTCCCSTFTVSSIARTTRENTGRTNHDEHQQSKDQQ